MEIITSYEAKLTKQLNTTPISEGVFRVSPQIKKSRIIEFFGDLYTYPPRFNIKWDSIDELHNDLFMSYNYRALEHSLPFMDILTSLSQDEKNVEKGTYSTNAYIEGYMNKIVSTRFYRKQTKKIQESLQTIPIYVILNGQGNIVLANSTDQLETSPNNFNSLLYNFCGNFDHLAEKNSQLGLFFISRDDAEQYLQEIAKSDTEGTKMFGLSIHCFGLDFAYRVMRDHHPEIDFRIIPELTEVQKLLTKETSNSNFIFENDQQQLRSRLRPITSIPILSKWYSPFYSFLEKDEYFKGTPIYIVQIAGTPKKIFVQKFHFVINLLDTMYGRITQFGDCIFGFGNNWIMQGSLENQKQHKNLTTYVFFEKDEALNFCKESKQNIQSYEGSHSSYFTKLIQKPKILVYNLEDFLELWEEVITKTRTISVENNSKSNLQQIFNHQPIQFIPTKGSFSSLTEYDKQPKESSFQKVNQFLNFKTRCLSGFIKSILNTN